MHIYMRLLQLFPYVVLIGERAGEDLPPTGFDYVVTSIGNRVVTSRSATVIALKYV